VIKYLLTEWKGRIGRYLARDQDERNKCSAGVKAKFPRYLALVSKNYILHDNYSENDSKARIDTNSKVFVKGLFYEDLLGYRVATAFCLNLLRMAMLEPHMVNIRLRMCSVQRYVECSAEVKRFKAVPIAAKTTRSVQIINITMRYAHVDSVRCFGGRCVA